MDDLIKDDGAARGHSNTGDWQVADGGAASTPPERTVHELSGCEVQPGGDEVGAEPPHPCEDNQWADILYLSGTGSFWLLTQSVSDALHEAADQLAGIVAESDPQRRLQKLNAESGLTDCIMPASVESFMTPEQRDTYRNKQRELVDANAQKASSRGASIRRASRKINELKGEIAALEGQGRKAAEEQGYEVEGDRYYGAWENAIDAALGTYQQSRAAYVLRAQTQGEAWKEALQEANRYMSSCQTRNPEEALSTCDVLNYADYLDEANGSVEAGYLQSILRLASMGVATPEFALANSTRRVSGVQGGIRAFDAYLELLGELPALTSAMGAKLDDWRDSTAGQATLPVFLLGDERRRYEQYCQRLDAVYAVAREATQAMQPRRSLFWDADVDNPRHALGYRKRSVQVVVRNNFPLREFSSPLGSKSLSHLSLHQLAALAMNAEEHDGLTRALPGDGALPGQLWEAEENALSIWLAGRGCQAIDWRREWHDEPMGLFQPERFFAYLEEQALQIDGLEGKREAWGQALQNMLFTGPSRDVLRLFDASAQAQYLRMVGMRQGDLNDSLVADRPDKVEATTPALSVQFMEGSASAATQGGVSAQSTAIGQPTATPPSGSGKASLSAKVEATFNLLGGELSLGRFSLPDETQASPIHVTLHNKGNERRSLGCYSLQLEPVLKGFAGASVALATETGLSLDHNGVSVVGLDQANTAGTASAFDAFAGVGIGVECSVALRWKPPRDIIQRLPKYAALDELGLLSAPLDDWGNLSSATLAGEALAGYGATADFQLGLVDGKFVLTLKGRLVFKVGYGGKLTVTLDPNRLDPWMGMLHQALVDNEYEVVDWITPEAFDGFRKLFFVQTMLLVDVGMLALRGLDTLDDLYTGFTRSERAGPIAYAIVDTASNPARARELRAWVQHLPPEAMGPLLHVLRAAPGFLGYEIGGKRYGRNEAIDLQQIAIAQCLEWIEEGYTNGHYPRRAAQRLFEKAVARMSVDGEYSGAEAGGDESSNESDDESARRQAFGRAYCESRYQLDQFMKHGLTDNFEAQKAREKYRSITSRLGQDMDTHCHFVQTPRGKEATYRET
ncbi:hypothetical protein RSO41_01550 [Halomonas sp. I1]|uniref:hypothetical protein n=1 Tax=Halomonas sp. I1 TaxID=393536 RepID=UPI0028DD4639|nr:hypothetical protein [Halomonas sp. I1]MDT8893326.1 hypothetical protein [Halomonas sp. I1]